MLIFETFLLLSIVFIIHILWWRISFPKNATVVFLFLFVSTFTVFLLISSIPFIELVRVGLLYFGAALVYIILYSAIDQESPTLKMIHYINAQRECGCEYEALIKYLSPEDHIKQRLAIMEKGGWLMHGPEGWELTNKSKKYAYFFDLSAKLFGLRQGG